MLRIVPITLKEANELVKDKHRHHKPQLSELVGLSV